VDSVTDQKKTPPNKVSKWGRTSLLSQQIALSCPDVLCVLWEQTNESVRITWAAWHVVAGGGAHQRLSPHCDIHQGQQGSQSLIEGQQDSEPGTQTLRGPHVLQEVGVPALAHTREAVQELAGSVHMVTGHTAVC
jgi:hypothetical protein